MNIGITIFTNRRIIILFTVFCFWHLTTRAQELRHVQGIGLIGVSCGISPGSEGRTHSFCIDYSRYIQKNWILNMSGIYEVGDVQMTKVKNYLLKGGVDYTTFQAGNFLYFNVGLSVLLGGETLDTTEILSGKKNSFVSGTSGNVNFEIYMTDRIVLQVKAEQNLIANSNLGSWYPVFYAGIKYCIF